MTESESEEAREEGNESVPSPGRIAVLVMGALVVVYVSAALTFYAMLPPEDQQNASILYPFGSGSTAEELHERGVEAFRADRYREAVEQFSRSLQKHEENPKGFFLLASAWAKMGEFERALETLRPLEGEDIDLPRLHARKAYWLLGMGRYEKARASARRFVGNDSVPDANRLYGYLVLNAVGLMMEDPDEANEAIREARSLDLPDESWPKRLLELLVDGSSPTGLSRGQQTEWRAWRAMRGAAEGRLEQARRDRRWVFEKGVASRYEHDLMLATRSSGLF